MCRVLQLVTHICRHGGNDVVRRGDEFLFNPPLRLWDWLASHFGANGESDSSTRTLMRMVN